MAVKRVPLFEVVVPQHKLQGRTQDQADQENHQKLYAIIMDVVSHHVDCVFHGEAVWSIFTSDACFAKHIESALEFGFGDVEFDLLDVFEYIMEARASL